MQNSSQAEWTLLFYRVLPNIRTLPATSVHIHPLAILVMQGIAFWPVWRWYGERITDGSDEPWGIVVLATAIVFLVWRGTPERIQMLPLGCAAALVTFHALSFPFLPALVRAILAVLTLSCTLSAFYLGRSLHLGIFGLLLLSLPLIASLQFYLGYPVRFLTAEIAARIITLTGHAVTAEGACLRWLGDLISVTVWQRLSLCCCRSHAQNTRLKHFPDGRDSLTRARCWNWDSASKGDSSYKDFRDMWDALPMAHARSYDGGSIARLATCIPRKIVSKASGIASRRNHCVWMRKDITGSASTPNAMTRP